MPLSSQAFDQVGALLRDVAARVIEPRFRALTAGEIEEKSPGELVTVVDREAERLVSGALVPLLEGSRVVGEEAAASRPALLRDLDQGDVWLVDPLDGTSNFIANEPCFALMVSLLERGETTCAWMFDPIAKRLSCAQLGSGAFVDGVRLHAAAPDDPELDRLRGAVLTKYMPGEMKALLEPRSIVLREVLPGMRCAGAEYPAIARGQQDFAVFFRTLPWDHAPGALFLNEAGGLAARFDRSPYRPTDTLNGLLAARNPAVWQRVQRGLLGGRAAHDLTRA